MARRKSELLDLLRKQSAQPKGPFPAGGKSSKTEDVIPAAAPSRSRPAAPPPEARPPVEKAPAATKAVPAASPRAPAPSRGWRRPEAIAGFLLLAVVVVFFLVWWLNRGSEPAAPPRQEITLGETPAERLQTAAELLSGPAAAEPPRYAVKVITYGYSEENRKLAAATKTALEASYTPVQAFAKPFQPPHQYIELYVGSAARGEELEELSESLQRLEYPARSGRKPFAGAQIVRLPRTQ